MSNDLNFLFNFVNEERKRFDVREGNLFASSFREISRYYDFLQIIIYRHNLVVQKYAKLLKSFQDSLDKGPGSHQYTDKQMEDDAELAKLMTEIHLEVESFYQFSKILLDKTAFAIEYYFGKRDGRKNRIEGHHFMVEKRANSEESKIEEYSRIKGLIISEELLNKMEELQEIISDFRDHNITHLRTPRTFRGVSISGRMIIGRLYPREEKDNIQEVSGSLEALLAQIREYLILVVYFFTSNKDKSVLPISR